MATTEQHRAAQLRSVEARRARGTNNSGSRLATQIVNGDCAYRHKWRGFDCRETWPVSRMIWCPSCVSFFAPRAVTPSLRDRRSA